MATTYNTELAKKMQPILDLATEEVFPKLREGAQNTVELAKEVGSASLERTATAAVDSADSMCKVFNELIECVEKFQEYNKRMEQALG